MEVGGGARQRDFHTHITANQHENGDHTAQDIQELFHLVGWNILGVDADVHLLFLFLVSLRSFVAGMMRYSCGAFPSLLLVPVTVIFVYVRVRLSVLVFAVRRSFARLLSTEGSALSSKPRLFPHNLSI